MTSIPLSKLDISKLLKLLPVAAFVLTLGFYYLFTFLRESGTPAEKTGKSAFNTDLPGPKLDDRYKNKLDLYMEARQDSLRKLKEARRDSLLFPVEGVAPEIVNVPPQLPQETRRATSSTDPNERKVEKVLERLQMTLAQQEAEPHMPNAGLPIALPSDKRTSADLGRLEKLMGDVANPPDDVEIKRLDGMLDKILEIQQPGRNPGHAKPVPDDTLESFIATVAGPKPSEYTDNGFYGLSEEPTPQSIEQPPGNGTIAATVHADQRVRTGSIVRLRLLQDIYVNNAKIPANSFVFGRATVAKERVELDIRHAFYANTVLPVKLTVFDIDGIAGISAPGADARDASREGLNQAVQNLELYNMDPSLGAQAAASGIQAAKSLLSKKTKTPYATLKANHKVMLVNTRF
ncbi:conjugative transposon protein TraM [Chitinophaga pollutisoli]|uniref:Conjugative transposon protein TraM n=2 Tax=Chitinophaga TaxID=79328 RepID=A0ABZ2YLV3_9BACT|nr:conjugative transposon protein TraM [Chitinophaga rhizosphaerae]